ncbi:hypothetical protein, partial [Staphylococcus saprophyticus]|uniref:hypothetical protein n=1 Tax=Staphylococcus saprophyticus TaxID=29385 RepID=UPI001C930343
MINVVGIVGKIYWNDVIIMMCVIINWVDMRHLLRRGFRGSGGEIENKSFCKLRCDNCIGGG